MGVIRNPTKAGTFIGCFVFVFTSRVQGYGSSQEQAHRTALLFIGSALSGVSRRKNG